MSSRMPTRGSLLLSRPKMRTGRWRTMIILTRIKSAMRTQYLVVVRSNDSGGTHTPPSLASAGFPSRTRPICSCSLRTLAYASETGTVKPSSLRRKMGSLSRRACRKGRDEAPNTLSCFFTIFSKPRQFWRKNVSRSTSSFATASTPLASRASAAALSSTDLGVIFTPCSRRSRLVMRVCSSFTLDTAKEDTLDSSRSNISMKLNSRVACSCWTRLASPRTEDTYATPRPPAADGASSFRRFNSFFIIRYSM
mmetsp:Transcript_18711/g.59650  ORF Transcript_18711/g.59650 Transcript_18711/m.59650 type:complete len:252 (-) Transcript_18711:106-861(-)